MRIGWPVIIEYDVLSTATICGNTTGVVMSRSKNASGEPSCVTRKCCAVSGRSGVHCASRPVRPDVARANQSPGVQFAERSMPTESVREQR